MNPLATLPDGAGLVAVIAAALAVSAMTWTPGPGPGIAVLVAVVLLLRTALHLGATWRRSLGRRDLPAATGDDDLARDILAAFAAIEKAETAETRASAKARMTPGFAALWGEAGKWAASRTAGERPRAHIVDWSLITRTRGAREAAWVRFILSGPRSIDGPDRTWVEHWVFVRTAAEPALTTCPSCAVPAKRISGGICTACNKPVRQARARWLVDSIAAASPRTGWMPERRRDARLPLLLDVRRAGRQPQFSDVRR